MAQSNGEPDLSNSLLDPESDPAPDRTKKKVTRRKVDNTTRPAKQTSRTDLTNDLTAMFGSFAMPLYAFSSVKPELAYDAHIIMTNAQSLAEQLNTLAQRNPAVHRVLFAMMNSTDALSLTVALSQIAVPILANHGVIPPATATMFGAPDPVEFLQNPPTAEDEKD